MIPERVVGWGCWCLGHSWATLLLPVTLQNDAHGKLARSPSYLAAPGLPAACPARPTAQLSVVAPSWAGALWKVMPVLGQPGRFFLVRNVNPAT